MGTQRLIFVIGDRSVGHTLGDGLTGHIDRAPELVAFQDRWLQLPVVDVSGSLSEIVDAVPALLT